LVDARKAHTTRERINITLPRRILRRLDDEARAGETRSVYIAKLAIGG